MISEEDISNIYQTLSNPIRRKIIEILGSRGSASLKELVDSLNVSTGSMYYNIELLGDLVERTPNKRFSLTEKGWMAYRLLMDGREKILEIKYYSKSMIPFKVKSKFLTMVFPRWFFQTICEYKPFKFIIPITILIFGSIICYFTNVELKLFSVAYKPLQWPIITALKFVASWIIIYIALHLFPLLFYGRTGGKTLLMIGLGISTIPLLFIPFVMMINTDYVIQGVIILILQFISCILLSTAISTSKNISLERAFLIAVLIIYLNITLNVIFRF